MVYVEASKRESSNFHKYAINIQLFNHNLEHTHANFCPHFLSQGLII